MPRYNLLLAQFIILLFLCGSPVGMITYALFGRYGFQGTFAGIIAGAISLSVIAFIIYRKWLIEKNYIPQIVPGLEPMYASGNKFVSIGNVIAILSIANPLFGTGYVLSGPIVLVGGFISILAWVGGWYRIKYSLVKYG